MNIANLDSECNHDLSKHWEDCHLMVEKEHHFF